MRGKEKGGTREGNMEEVNNGYIIFKYRGKNSSAERKERGGAHMRETSRRRITVTSSLKTEGKTPHEREGKGGHTCGKHGGGE